MGNIKKFVKYVLFAFISLTIGCVLVAGGISLMEYLRVIHFYLAALFGIFIASLFVAWGFYAYKEDEINNRRSIRG